MLSQALLVLDETVTQGATPAEVGGFSLSPDKFHVVVANVGGLYAEVEVSSGGPVTFPPRPHSLYSLAQLLTNRNPCMPKHSHACTHAHVLHTLTRCSPLALPLPPVVPGHA